MPKVIWIDNTQPPTNYVWMKTDLNDKLIGVYEYIKDKWREIDVDAIISKQYYTKWDVDFMLKIAKQEILQRIASSSYDITEIVVDSELDSESTNPVSNNVLTEIINSKQDKIQNLNAIKEGAMRGSIAYVKPSTGIRKIDLEESLQRTLTDIENIADIISEDFYTKEQVTNLISSFVDNAVDNLVNYYTKTEIDTKLSNKQDTLVSGTNIKTINGQSIIGSGNITLSGDGGALIIDNELSDSSENVVQNKVIKAALDTKSEFSGSYNDLTDKPEIKSRKAFKTSWPTSTTLTAFCQAVINDSDAKVGEAYLGSLSCSGLPSGVWIGDTVVEIIGTDYNKVVKLTVTSTEVAPYHWEASYWQGGLYGWRSFELDSNKVTSLSAASTNAQYPSAKLVYDQLATKQNTISDLTDIRSGAGLGATAYQKPQSGIPASDLANGVIPTDTLKYSAQTLTSEQKAQVKTNLDIVDGDPNAQKTYNVSTSQVTNPKEGDICDVPETVIEDNVQSRFAELATASGGIGVNRNGVSTKVKISFPNTISTASGSFKKVTFYNQRTDIIGAQWQKVCDVSVTTNNPTAIYITITYVSGEVVYVSAPGYQSMAPVSAVLSTIIEGLGYFKFEETEESIADEALLYGIKIQLITEASNKEYSNGQWVNRDTFSNELLDNKLSISVGNSAPENPKEGDIWEKPAYEVEISPMNMGVVYWLPNSEYALRITGPMTNLEMIVNLIAGGTETITVSDLPKEYEAGVVGYLYSSIVDSEAPYTNPTVTNFQEGGIFEYFNGSWINRKIDSIPTASSTNLVTSGGVYTALQSAGGNNANAQVRASSEAGATSEGDICNSQIVLTDGYLTGAEDDIYNLVSLSGNLVIGGGGGEWGHVNLSRWTGSEFEQVLRCMGVDFNPSTIFDLKNDTTIPWGSNISLADYFTPDTGDMAKIRIDMESGYYTFNVGENNATIASVVENFGGTFHKRMPSDDVVRFSDQSLTNTQKETARENIGAASTGDIDRCQKLLDIDAYSYSDGDITQTRKITPEGNDLVNTFTQDYLSYPTLRAVGASVFDTTGETVTIHDNDMNIDLFRIVVEAGNNYADVYDKDEELVYSIWEGGSYYYDMEIGDDYLYDSITIASTASSSNISIYQCQTDILKYEVYDGESVPRIPAFPEIVDYAPYGGFEPNKMYDLGVITGTITFTLATPKYDSVANHWYWTFDTGSTAPTITWPANISWNGGSAPTINDNKHYEISVLNGIGVYMEV